MRRVLRSSAVALATISAVVLSACSSGTQVDDVFSAGGWPGMHADARNSDTSPVTGSRDISLAWTRPIGGPVANYASVAASGQIFLTARTEQGCNLFSFQMESGRKRWCRELGPGVVASTPIVDGAANVYVGENGAINSFNEHGQLRWRTPVVGTPLSAQFTGDGNLLFITQLGQINVVNTQNGQKVMAPYDLIPPPSFTEGADVDIIPDDQGLDSCFFGSPDCPVANMPAIDLETGKFYFTFFPPDAPEAELVAMKYSGGDNPAITPEWSTDALPGGSASSPGLSGDNSVVYANDNEGKLWALDTATGDPKWSYDIGFAAAGSPSTSADGLIIPAGGANGHLLALRDEGDHAELVWEQKDLLQLGVPAQTAGSTGYAVVREGTDGLAMITFDTQTGEIVDQDTLPGAKGFTVGTSIGPKGEVLTPTLIGELFVLR
ncbi:outer membrane protein assembly factor BamB family protein [Rhodococcus marinonascens]|uniref:outer membrane protein assembly factor BamB family protein n=1 Tax=Rhodococcus marinonascens TaxID=38311 RepID=UPI0009327A92|nr:PQQ-binding-like beta-propeller repeat protein [Rhodococcus marinonascens]